MCVCVCPLITLPFVFFLPPHSLQAAQRGVKQAAPTQADPDDPCAANYGDYAMVQSTEISGRKWTKVEQLTPDLAGQKVRGWCCQGVPAAALHWRKSRVRHTAHTTTRSPLHTQRQQQWGQARLSTQHTANHATGCRAVVWC